MRCTANRNTWLHLLAQADSAANSPSRSLSSGASFYSTDCPVEKLRLDESQDIDLGATSGKPTHHNSDPHPTFVFSSVLDALRWATQGHDPLLKCSEQTMQVLPPPLKDFEHVQILVTGSLHLVGGVLGLVMPNVNEH